MIGRDLQSPDRRFLVNADSMDRIEIQQHFGNDGTEKLLELHRCEPDGWALVWVSHKVVVVNQNSHPTA